MQRKLFSYKTVVAVSGSGKSPKSVSPNTKLMDKSAQESVSFNKNFADKLSTQYETKVPASDKSPTETKVSVSDKSPTETIVSVSDKSPNETKVSVSDKSPDETKVSVSDKSPNETKVPASDKLPIEVSLKPASSDDKQATSASLMDSKLDNIIRLQSPELSKSSDSTQEWDLIGRMLRGETESELNKTQDPETCGMIKMRCFNELMRRTMNPQGRLFSFIKDAFIEPEKRNAGIRKLIQDYPSLINSRDKYGYTPLILAAREKRSDVIGLLFDNKADVNAFTNRGDSALFWAAPHSNVVELLIQLKADANHKANDNRTALHAVNGSLASTQILIDAGADVSAEDKKGSTPLIEAVHTTLGAEYQRILVVNSMEYELCVMSNKEMEDINKVTQGKKVKQGKMYITALNGAIEYAVLGKDNTTVYRSIISADQLGIIKDSKEEIGQQMTNPLGIIKDSKEVIEQQLAQNADYILSKIIEITSRRRHTCSMPKLEQMQPTEIIVVVKDKLISAFWIEEDAVKMFSLPESKIPGVAQKLPKAGGYSFSRGLIDEIVTNFGLKKAEKSLCAKALIRAGANPSHRDHDGLSAFKFELYKKANALNGIPGEAYESPLLELKKLTGLK